MAKKFSELFSKMPPEAQERVNKRVQQTLDEMPLHELRRAREISQQTLAKAMDTTQPEVSRIEQRVDMYVSTVRSYIEALGGRLDLVATFPDGRLCRINQFSDLDEGATGSETSENLVVAQKSGGVLGFVKLDSQGTAKV